MDYKYQIKKAYDEFGEEYDRRAQEFLTKWINNEVELFLDNLNGRKILDVGCGPGRDLLFFKNKGLNPVGIDISSTMIKLCREKDLEAYEMDLENLNLNESFDGIWAYVSLIHMPKEKLNNVLVKISSLLKEKGVVFIGMLEGDFEGLRESKNYPNHKRFVSFYQDKEFRKYLEKHFEIIKFSRTIAGKNYINYLCKKRPDKPNSSND